MDYKEILEKQVAKQKEDYKIRGEFIIEVQALANLAAQVSNPASQAAPEFKGACDYLRTLCDQIGSKALEFKPLIPDGNKTNETNEVN